MAGKNTKVSLNLSSIFFFLPFLSPKQCLCGWREQGSSLDWLCLSCLGLFSEKGAAQLPSCPCSPRASPEHPPGLGAASPFLESSLGWWCQVTHLFTELAKGLTPDLGYTSVSLLGLYPYIPYKPQGLPLFLIF